MFDNVCAQYVTLYVIIFSCMILFQATNRMHQLSHNVCNNSCTGDAVLVILVLQVTQTGFYVQLACLVIGRQVTLLHPAVIACILSPHSKTGSYLDFRSGHPASLAEGQTHCMCSAVV